MATDSSILAGKSHGQRSLSGYSPRGRKESDPIKHRGLGLGAGCPPAAAQQPAALHHGPHAAHQGGGQGQYRARRAPRGGTGHRADPQRVAPAPLLPRPATLRHRGECPAARAVGAVGAMGEGVLDRSKLRPLGRALIEPAEGTSGCVSVLTLWVPPGLVRTAGAKIC